MSWKLSCEVSYHPLHCQVDQKPLHFRFSRCQQPFPSFNGYLKNRCEPKKLTMTCIVSGLWTLIYTVQSVLQRNDKVCATKEKVLPLTKCDLTSEKRRLLKREIKPSAQIHGGNQADWYGQDCNSTIYHVQSFPFSIPREYFFYLTIKRIH